MSAKSRILRDMYGVEPKPKTAKSKYAFYREQRAQRGEILRRAEQEFDKAQERRRSMKGDPQCSSNSD